MSTPQEHLTSFAKHHHVSTYYNSRDLLAGKPWIKLFARGVCLAEFCSVKEALAWFPIH
jgi:hypothetical protein